MSYTCGVCVAAGMVVRRGVCRGCEETRGNYTTSARRRCRTPSLRAPRRARRLAFRRPAPWFVRVAALAADARRRRPALVSRSREKPSTAAHRAPPQLLSSARPQAADGRPAPLAYNCACANAASSFAPEDTVIEVCCIGLATSLPPSGAPRYGGMPNDCAERQHAAESTARGQSPCLTPLRSEAIRVCAPPRPHTRNRYARIRIIMTRDRCSPIAFS